MFGTIGGDEEPRHFMYRGFSLLCKPHKLAFIQSLIDLYQSKLCLSPLKNSTNKIFVRISWERVFEMVKEQPGIWKLLFALGVLTHTKNGNVEIRPRADLLLRFSSEPDKAVYFTSILHARMCLATVFAEYRGRHIYVYNEKGELIEDEDFY